MVSLERRGRMLSQNFEKIFMRADYYTIAGLLAFRNYWIIR
jgi:hypothetical protein